MAFNHGKAIEVSNLIKYYGDLLAVDPSNFEVHQGVVFGFFGPNCAGKTTAQRMLTTLLEPTDQERSVAWPQYRGGGGCRGLACGGGHPP
jgi:ABC-2 type transport system ATP-binding protein